MSVLGCYRVETPIELAYPIRYIEAYGWLKCRYTQNDPFLYVFRQMGHPLSLKHMSIPLRVHGLLCPSNNVDLASYFWVFERGIFNLNLVS